MQCYINLFSDSNICIDGLEKIRKVRVLLVRILDIDKNEWNII